MALLYKDWGLHIRQGNWMWLWCGINSMAKKAGNKLYISKNYFLWDYLEIQPNYDEDFPVDETFHFRQTHYTSEEENYIVNYWKENKDKNININLGSHLQSLEWWKDDIEYIKSIIKIKDSEKNKVYEKYFDLFKDGKPTIGIGCRRGDMVGHGCFYQINPEWYIKALEAEFPNWGDCVVVVFSDNIEECKQLFKAYPFRYADANQTYSHANNFREYHSNPMDQFILGTLIDNFITSQSTFSVWQALYVDLFNKGKIVHCNKNLAGECLEKFYNPDFYPKNWIIHPIKNEK